MSRYGTDTKERLHIGRIQQKIGDKLLVISVSHDFKCPLCGHGHFEVYANGLLKCFSCSTTFFEKDLIKKCGNS